MLYIKDMKSASKNPPIGIMADSHGNNELLLKAITTLKSMGSKHLIHLGDMCDSLSPHLIEETLAIMREYKVEGVRGNNECTMIQDFRTAHGENGSRDLIRLLDELPYTIRSGSMLFTHSIPMDHPIATKRPVSEFMNLVMKDGDISFSLLFRGHSHRPSILEIDGKSVKKIPAGTGKEIPLERNGRYVITVGAIENASCALFLLEEYSVRFIAIPKS